jgi:hypothetical protein
MAANATKSKVHFDPCPGLVEVLTWMNGNGQKGAKVRLALIEDNLGEITGTLKWIKNAVAGLIVAILLSCITYFIFQVIPHVGGS